MGDFLEEEYYTDELGKAIDVGLEFAEKSVIEFWWDRCRADGAGPPDAQMTKASTIKARSA